jgi:hypothetical protein
VVTPTVSKQLPNEDSLKEPVQERLRESLSEKELLLRELKVDLSDAQRAVAALRRTLVGLTDEGDLALARGGQFGADTRVRHLIGVDPNRQAVAIADTAARSLWTPLQIPVGVLTALLGVPVVLLLLARRR